MFRMYREAALNRLVDLVYDNPDKPAGTIFEMWRNELLDYQDKRLEAHRAALKDNQPIYALQFGEVFTWSDAGGGDVREYRPARVVYFAHDKVRDTSKKIGVPEKVVWQLIRGQVFDWNGWRGLLERGTSNTAYVPTNRDKLEMREQIKREDIQIQAYREKQKPYVPAKQPIIEDYTK